MSTATFARTLSYRSVGNVATSATSDGVSALYTLGAQHSDSGVDVPDAASDNTEYEIAFGSVAEATYLEVKNSTGQAVKLHLNQHSFDGTLVSGTATVAVPVVDGECLSLELGDDNGGTPGDDVAIRRSGGNVIVTAYNSSGVESLDVSDVTILQSTPVVLTNGGMAIVANPTAVGGTSKLSEAKAVLTAVQSGAGRIAYKMFGDPV
jgi:hypothetical protein